jgi:crotonobetaine/carnitine-CoA ligase
MTNLSELLLRQREHRPELTLGVIDDTVTLDWAVEMAARAARVLGDSGLEPGERVAMVGRTSTDYLLFWMTCQLAGLSPSLINPDYPTDLLAAMIGAFAPKAIASADGGLTLGLGVDTIAFDRLRAGELQIAGRRVRLPEQVTSRLPGVSRDELACAGFMHTSGTTGAPKFCSQSHRYFLRLGRYVADFLGWSEEDRVFAPLPMFHINPLGYGLLGALTAGADLTALERFVPEFFWAQVKATRASALVLHAPPVRVIQQRCTPADSDGHRVRNMFYADGNFMERFAVPAAAAGYGSTEAGGLTHLRLWRRGEQPPNDDAHVGIGHRVGTARPDVEWTLDDEGEILVRGVDPGVIFDGYWIDGALRSAVEADGWFATGDNGGRIGDELVFQQRRNESIRVRGEYIPIQYVEQQIAVACSDIDVALWKVQDGDVSDERAVLYVVGESLPLDEIRSAIAHLPRFMRPVEVVRVNALPLDGGAGKVRRSLLGSATVIESLEL